VEATVSPNRRLESFARAEAADLYSFFRRCLGNAEQARDLVQETLLYAWKNLALYDAERPFRAWIFRIGQNRLRSFLKRKKLHRAFEEDAQRRPAALAAAPEEVLAMSEEERRLELAVRALPERQRIAVILRYHQGMSCREIGEVLEASENAVSILLYHARRDLKRRLAGQGDGS